MPDTEKEALCARIDELCAEVEALKREKPRTMLSVTARHVAELQAENAKLKKLVLDMWEFFCVVPEDEPHVFKEELDFSVEVWKRMCDLGLRAED